MKSPFIISFLFLFAVSCDLVKPQQTFKLAIPTDDEGYAYASEHLKQFLELGGFEIEVVNVSNAIEANEMVARGDADLTFVKNHGLFVPEALDVSPTSLRTLMPFYTNLMLLYSKEWKNLKELGKKELKIRVDDSEAFLDLFEIFQLSEVHNVKIAREGSADLIYFWGTLYEEKSKKLSREGWFPVSLEADWEEFLLLNNPGLRKFKLPAVPGVRNSESINTMASETLLVCSSTLGENTIHDLSKYIFNNKLRLLEKDRMYRAINEHFDQENLLYPLHEGTHAYLRRDEPTVLESYSELLALIVALVAIGFGAMQAVKLKSLIKRKEWADQYYLDFLLVKESGGASDVKHKRLDSLFGRALTYMTQRKISKKDFHTLSRLIQDEQANLNSKN